MLSALGLTTLYHRIALQRETLPIPGVLFSISSDQTIHIHEDGDESDSSLQILFSSGSGTSSPYADMYLLQNHLAQDYSTVLYERPGYGFSPPNEENRSLETVIFEIERVLLSTNNEENPIVFIAHSMAALEAFRYAQLHPNEVAGIILLDGVNPEFAQNMEQVISPAFYLLRFVRETGVIRALSYFDSVEQALTPSEELPEQVKEINISMTNRHLWNKTMLEERQTLNESGETIVQDRTLGDIPLLILTATETEMDDWQESQEELLEWSRNSEQVLIEGADHNLHHTHQDKIIKEIEQFLNQFEGDN